MLDEIKDKQKKFDVDPLQNALIGRRFSKYFTWIMIKLGIHPIGVTALSGVFIIFAGYLFLSPNPINWILAWVSMQFYHILDCSDGEVARMTGKGSKFGALFDGILHPFGNSLLFACASLGLGSVPLAVFFAAAFPMHSWIRLQRVIHGIGKVDDVPMSRKGLRIILSVFVEAHANILLVLGIVAYLGFDYRLVILYMFAFSVISMFVYKLFKINRELN